MLDGDTWQMSAIEEFGVKDLLACRQPDPLSYPVMCCGFGCINLLMDTYTQEEQNAQAIKLPSNPMAIYEMSNP